MRSANRLEKPRFELRPLPFGMDALAPHISRETLEYHHGKHHRAYVDKLNELVAGTKFEGMSLEDVVREASGETFNNAAQAWNHDFYWSCLSPRATRPAARLTRAIEASFGSFDSFEQKFKESAERKFGSGWTWLVRSGDGKLEIRNADDADNPLRWGVSPLLTCDVWEHAYYVDYRNARPKYIDAFWRLVNWGFVSENFGTA